MDPDVQDVFALRASVARDDEEGKIPANDDLSELVFAALTAPVDSVAGRQRALCASSRRWSWEAYGNVDTVELSLGEYEAIRTSPVHFLVKPGHDYPEFERVVDENDRYAVVEKFGEAAEVVRKLDPRSA